MCEALGYRVVSLIRLRVVNLELGDLPVGQNREAPEEEVKNLWKALRIGNEGEKAEEKDKHERGEKRGRGKTGARRADKP